VKLAVLGSGSRGNAVILRTAGVTLLVDAGFGPRTLARRAEATGIPLEPLAGIVLTHEHGDHARGAVALARRLHPGQRNSLDALCKRYNVDNSGRDLHGALKDARILADVYLSMTGGQAALGLDAAPAAGAAASAGRASRGDVHVPVPQASAAELAAHEQSLDAIDRASGGRTLFRAVSPRGA